MKATQQHPSLPHPQLTTAIKMAKRKYQHRVPYLLLLSLNSFHAEASADGSSHHVSLGGGVGGGYNGGELNVGNGITYSVEDRREQSYHIRRRLSPESSSPKLLASLDKSNNNNDDLSSLHFDSLANLSNSDIHAIRHLQSQTPACHQTGKWHTSMTSAATCTNGTFVNASTLCSLASAYVVSRSICANSSPDSQILLLSPFSQLLDQTNANNRQRLSPLLGQSTHVHQLLLRHQRRMLHNNVQWWRDGS